MRLKVYSAVFFSIILIGMAAWMRFSMNREQVPNLVAVELKGTEMVSDTLKGESIATSSVEMAAAKPLTGTDLVGRQLIMDYIGLSRAGQASSANIESLAENYIKSIPTLLVSERAMYTDLNVVTNSRENLLDYVQFLAQIQISYASDSQKLKTPTIDPEKLGGELYEYAGKMEGIYQKTALLLKGLAVPGMLAEKHLELINVYLSSASAMRSVVSTEADPATAFAGIIAWSENLNKEQMILLEINKILVSNDV